MRTVCLYFIISELRAEQSLNTNDAGAGGGGSGGGGGGGG